MEGPNHPTDIFLSVCYGICFLFGVPANLLSLQYFLSEPNKLSILLYRIISANDVLVSAFALPVMLSIGTRSPIMFGSVMFCGAWSVLWDICTSFSVFLVGAMSITRTYMLIFPHKRISNIKLLVCVGCYLAFLILFFCLPLSISTPEFTKDDGYCWSNNRGFFIFGINGEMVISIIHICLQVLPILPVTISCVIAVCLLNRDIKLGNKGNWKQQATLTIIMFTGLYIVCNVPIVVLYLFYISCYSTYPAPHFTSSFMKYYSWNVLYILSVCVNSACNPLIYITRNGTFKSHLLRISSDPAANVVYQHAGPALQRSLTNVGREMGKTGATSDGTDPTGRSVVVQQSAPAVLSGI